MNDQEREIAALREQVKDLENQVAEMQEELIDEEWDNRESDELTAKISRLAIDGLKVESPHHKQWFLEQIAIKLEADLSAVVYEPAQEPFPKPSLPYCYF